MHIVHTSPSSGFMASVPPAAYPVPGEASAPHPRITPSDMYQSCGLIEYRSCWSHVSDGGKAAVSTQDSVVVAL